MTETILVIIAAALVNRTVFAKVSEDPVRDAALSGAAAWFVMTLSAVVCRLICALAPEGLESLNLVLYLLAAGGIGWLCALVLRSQVPVLYTALGGGLRLAALNAAVMGVLTAGEGAAFPESIGLAFFAGLVFTASGVIFAGILDRMEETDLPVPVRGLPSVLLTAALVSMALLSLAGLSF